MKEDTAAISLTFDGALLYRPQQINEEHERLHGSQADLELYDKGFPWGEQTIGEIPVPGHRKRRTFSAGAFIRITKYITTGKGRNLKK